MTKGAQPLPKAGGLPSRPGRDPCAGWSLLSLWLPPTRAPPPCLPWGRARGSGPKLP